MSFSSGKNLQNNINTTENQTLSNKTLLGDTNKINGANIVNCTITNASIESPSKLEMKQYADLATAQADLASRSGGELIYVSDIKKTFQVNDDLGTKTLAEISGGQGGVNYIENSDFEQGVDGYSASGGNFTIAQTKVVGEVLRGEASAKLSKTADDATGQEISVPFTVSRADLAKRLTISIEKDASDPAYADDDIQIYVKQDPNGSSSVIRINGEDLKGGKGTHYAQFQTDASQTEYELVFKVNSGNLSAYDVIIDDVKVGPTNLAKGVIVTDWVELNTDVGEIIEATGTNPTYGTVANNTARWRRVGPQMELEWDFAQTSPGSTGTGGYLLNLPSGYSIDTTVKSINTNLDVTDTNLDFNSGVGTMHLNFINSGGGGSKGVAVLTPYSSTQLKAILTFTADDGISDMRYWGDTGYALGVAGSKVSWSVKASIPIQGWSSEAVMSEDLGGREIALSVRRDTNQAIGTSTTDIVFNTVTQDTTASFNTSTGIFTVPESGIYDISTIIRLDTSATPAAQHVGRIYRLDSSGSTLENIIFTGATDLIASKAYTYSGAVKFKCNKGDQIKVTGQSVTNSSTLLSGQSYLFITKEASPQTILETETVAARYNTNNGQTILSSDTTIVYEDRVADTHNAYNTSSGVYTVPVSGWYQINASCTHDSAIGTIDNGSFMDIVIKVNGSPVKIQVDRVAITTVLELDTLEASDLYYLEKSDEVTITSKNDASNPSTVDVILNGVAAKNTFSIARIK